MTMRGGGRPRGRGPAYLGDVDIDEEHYARAPEPARTGRRGRAPQPPRAGGRPPQAPRDGRGFGLGGLLRLLLFMGVLAGIVIIVGLTVLRPVVARAVVDWASDNPSALGLPFVKELVREDLGPVLTEPASSDAAQLEFTVADGDSAALIAGRLQEQGFLRDARAFVFISTEKDLADKLEAGTYILRKNMTPDEVVNALLVSKDVAVSIGLREGLRLEQITAKLQTLPLTMDVQAFYDEAKKPPKALLDDYSWLDLPKGASLEGFLAPATYRVLPDVTPDELIRRMLDRFEEAVGPDRLKVAKSRGLTFYQVLTLASIVEREAVVDEERPLIAGVYENRLDNAPFILNADPTVLYANDTMELGKLKFPEWKDYAFWSPPGGALKDIVLPEALAGYQSYVVGGLPPGPICTPTVASIDAALEPNDKTGYFFFVAIPDGGGKHAFAKTYKEHQANLKKYGY
jgi:peptidoglycan lytic transglycosylase G